jgi:2-polyprenyl-6-hydroxyphenyl methylase/3-demethylubiquinone-9 3-methyltransferase
VESSEYRYSSPEPAYDSNFLWRAVRDALLRYAPPPASVFEIGCGAGVNARRIASLGGYTVTATDPSHSGIAAARSVPGEIRYETASVYDDLAGRFGSFDVVVAFEVIEHLYAPRELIRSAVRLLRPGGHLLLSTPYHGWLKNVLIAATGRFDAHVNPLWDHGHVKFFSPTTLRKLLPEERFSEVELRRLGRVPAVAKTMLLVARRDPVTS